MDNRYYENVIAEMKPFLDEQGFKLLENGSFSNNAKNIRVNYDEARQMYALSVADISPDDNTLGDYREINAWLFDDSQIAKDATSVGIDFTASLRKELGIKNKRNSAALDIELPTASKSDTMNVTGFTKKMLDVFPTLKDAYKEHVALYGNFLYINFFGEHLVSCYKELLSTHSKKQIRKLYDVLSVAYIKGDKETVNIMVALLCAASYQDDAITAEIRAMLDENKHFLASFDNFIPVFATNKKLQKALLK